MLGHGRWWSCVVAWLFVAGGPAYGQYDVSGQGDPGQVIRPGVAYFPPAGIGYPVFRPVTPDPFGPYSLIGGYARAATSFPQPSGHEIIPTGPNGYVYRPTYGSPGYGPPTATWSKGTETPTIINGQPLPPTVGNNPNPVVGVHPWDVAVRAFRHGQFAAARNALQPFLAAAPIAAQVDPTEAAAAADVQWASLARLLVSHSYFAEDRWADSARELRSALASLPENMHGMILDRYREFYVATRYTQHLANLEAHVARNPTDADAQLLLGYHAAFLGQTPSALPHLRRAVELQPDDAVARGLWARFGSPLLVTPSKTYPGPRGNDPGPIVVPRELEPGVFQQGVDPLGSGPLAPGPREF